MFLISNCRHLSAITYGVNLIALSYVMAERCLQVEIKNIFKDRDNGDYDTLTYILEGGFKGFHNMDSSELIEEYKGIEDQWYQLESDGELPFEAYEDDPIHTLKEGV